MRSSVNGAHNSTVSRNNKGTRFFFLSFYFLKGSGWVWWPTPVISVLKKVETRGFIAWAMKTLS